MINRSKKAFSMLELVVVIVILGIIAGLAVPTFVSATTKSRQAVAIDEAKGFVRDAIALASFNTALGVSTDDSAAAVGEISGATYVGTVYTAANGCYVSVEFGTNSDSDVTVGTTATCSNPA